MKSLAITVRSIALLAVGCCLLGIGTQSADAQTVTVSPARLTFGVPTGSTVSAPETVTFTFTGGQGPASVTLDPVTITTGDFTIATDSCSNKTIASPGSCSVSVTFTPKATPGTLETGTLGFPNNQSEGTPTVALSGASGAIKLFDPINVAKSNPSATLGTLFAFKSETLAVSCSAEPSAVLSSSPDGLGNVVVDNFLTLNTTNEPQPTPITTDNVVGNVCPGNLGNPSDGGQPNCFTSAYQGPAGNTTQLDGQNPDTFANSGNGVLTGGAAGGVPPINVSGQFSTDTTNATITLLDGGGKVASSSLFLKTNCSSTGVKTGGTITGNPLDPNNPGSLAQDFPFNTTPGKHITLTGNFVTANTFDGTTTPTVNDTGLTQPQFAALVAGSSAAPALCIRLNGEVADDGVTKLCKAFTITCTDAGGVSAGVNCPQAAARTLLFETKLDSPDPVVIAPGTGPGLLMGTDNWVGNGTPCGTFGAGDGEVANQLCPQNPLTEFKGTGDPISGSTPRGVNSTFIPVLNMPLPVTTFTTTPPMTATGWVNSRTVTINFSSQRATYSGPNPNGFTAAPIASFTYGTQTSVPDPTFPANGDISFSNGSCPTGGAEPFTNNVPITFASDGTFNNVHYFATDCANTEELLFTPNTEPTVNWASYKTVPIKIDTVKPNIGAITFTPSSTGNIFGVGQSVHVTFACSDDLSGLAAPCTGTGGVLSGGLLNTSASQVGTQTFTVTAVDNAGNVQTSQVSYQIVGGADLVMLNLAPPTVKHGANLTYSIVLVNFGPAIADNVVVKETLPAGETFLSAGFGTVLCSAWGCTDLPAAGTPCAVSGNVVTCNIPTVGLVRNFTGVLVKIVVKVTAPAGTILKAMATETEANTDPRPANNLSTATTRVVSSTRDPD
jgi:uncharacterized repeat protein (TIGR01451 family)